jgi:hypothetical protein
MATESDALKQTGMKLKFRTPNVADYNCAETPDF